MRRIGLPPSEVSYVDDYGTKLTMRNEKIQGSSTTEMCSEKFWQMNEKLNSKACHET